METSKSLIPVPKDFIPKSFWEKPEGTTGMVLLALGIFVGGYLLLPVLTSFLGIAIHFMANIYIAGAMAIGLGILALVVSSSRTWTLAKILFKNFSRWITYKVIRCDPFGTLRTCRNSIAELFESFTEQVNALHGKKIGLKRVIDENAEKQKKAGKLAIKANEEGQESEAHVQGRQFKRLQDSNAKLAKVYRLMEVLEAALRKYQEKCDELVRDLDNEITVREQEYEAIEISASAISTAKKILSGGTDEREVLDMTMEYLAQNYEDKMGAIEGFLQQSQGMITGFDLQSSLDNEAAMKAIEDWTKKGDKLLLEHLDSDLLPDLSVPGLHDESKIPDYVSLLNNNK